MNARQACIPRTERRHYTTRTSALCSPSDGVTRGLRSRFSGGRSGTAVVGGRDQSYYKTQTYGFRPSTSGGREVLSYAMLAPCWSGCFYNFCLFTLWRATENSGYPILAISYSLVGAQLANLCSRDTPTVLFAPRPMGKFRVFHFL